MTPATEAMTRFAADLGALASPAERLGIAVSGGPDSLALLLLAAAARPGSVEAATVDHGLRDGSADEAAMVAALCQRLDVPHQILTADWAEPPSANIQAEARAVRYRLLGGWAQMQRLPAVATAHHADDQAGAGCGGEKEQREAVGAARDGDAEAFVRGDQRAKVGGEAGLEGGVSHVRIVIASGAKQSSLFVCAGLPRRCAPRNDGRIVSRTWPRTSPLAGSPSRASGARRRRLPRARQRLCRPGRAGRV